MFFLIYFKCPIIAKMVKLMELPYEIFVYILAQLSYPHLMQVKNVSKAVSKFYEDNYFWKIKVRRDFKVDYDYPPYPREFWEEDYRFHMQELEYDLMNAVKQFDVEKVKELSKFGVDVNCRDIDGTLTPLMRAAQFPDTSIAKILLDHGANIHAKTTRNRNTALQIAVSAGQEDMAKFLIERDADVLSKNRVGSEVIRIAKYMSTEFLDLLLDNGADINNADNWNVTLLHIVSGSSNNGKCIQHLIERGAVLDVKDISRRGYSPLICAVYSQLSENVKVLLDNGVNISIKSNEGFTALDIVMFPGYPNERIREIILGAAS